MAKSEAFPDCCAFVILNHFGGGHPGAPTSNIISEGDLNTFLATKEKELFNARTGLLVALSEPQEGAIGHVFRERKWECLLDGIPNPRTDGKIWLYFRNLNYTKAREKRIFGANR